MYSSPTNMIIVKFTSFSLRPRFSYCVSESIQDSPICQTTHLLCFLGVAAEKRIGAHHERATLRTQARLSACGLEMRDGRDVAGCTVKRRGSVNVSSTERGVGRG